MVTPDKVVSVVQMHERGLVAVTEAGFVFWTSGNIQRWTPDGKEYKTLNQWIEGE
jgi:hypothetical protein